jgi:hypothetical protein
MKRSVLLLGIMDLGGAFLAGQAAGAIPISACGTVIGSSGDYVQYATSNMPPDIPSASLRL